MNNRIRVAVNGYGVIGKRVADAVMVQPDMKLSGIMNTVVPEETIPSHQGSDA